MPVLRLLAGALAGALTVGLLALPATPATAKVTDSAVFNDPLVAAKQYTISKRIRSLIDAAPGKSKKYGGAIIRVAMYVYTSTEQATVDALIRAAKRGVTVRLLLDSDGALEPGFTHYGDYFRTLEQKYPKFHVTFCPIGRGCIGNAHPGSNNHNKFFLFSRTDGSTKVVVQSSANLNKTNSAGYWNNAVVLANAGLYDDYVAYFNDLWKQQPSADYGRVKTSGNAKVWHFPVAAGDPIAETLSSDVRCTGNTKVGSKGRTVIRVAMKDFYRIEVAEALWQLADRGCLVDVAYDVPATFQPYLGQSDAVVAALSRPLTKPGGRVRLFLAGPATTENPARRLIHSKYMLIEGYFAGKKNTKVVFTGSHNFSYGSLRDNDETVLRVTSAKIHDQFRTNFTRILSTLD
ncbi:MAG: phospholipase D-like domain-containing protein [Micropruina sp.]|uniref:phospholipase D-like domain-containing protein n=1 Tax=Micropruina sp. TaxID=2737536 RepID=UPI0039E48343